MKTSTVRIHHVASIITDYWPHRMSYDAAKEIDRFYNEVNYKDFSARDNTFLSMMEEVAAVNAINGWYDSERSFGEDIALLHSEVSEAFEGYRNNDLDNVAEEMADILIRLLDTCFRHKIALVKNYTDKLEKNRQRGYKHGGKVL